MRLYSYIILSPNVRSVNQSETFVSHSTSAHRYRVVCQVPNNHLEHGCAVFISFFSYVHMIMAKLQYGMSLLECGESLAALIYLDCDTSRVAFKYFGLRQFIAALISHHFSCRFCISQIAPRPPTAFDFITLSCHFGSTVRLNAVKQVPLLLRQRTLPDHEN